MHALARERVQIGRQCRNERLAFARAHFGDLAEVQHHAANQLNVEVAHLEDALAGFAAHRKGFDQQRIHARPLGDTLLEFLGLAAQLLIAQLGDLRLEGVDRRDGFLVLLDKPLVTAAKYFFKKTGNHRITG